MPPHMLPRRGQVPRLGTGPISKATPTSCCVAPNAAAHHSPHRAVQPPGQDPAPHAHSWSFPALGSTPQINPGPQTEPGPGTQGGSRRRR